MATQDKDRVFSMTRVNMVNRMYKGMGTQDIQEYTGYTLYTVTGVNMGTQDI